MVYLLGNADIVGIETASTQNGFDRNSDDKSS